MNTSSDEDAPDWVARFLDALREGLGPKAAASAAGVSESTPRSRRMSHPAFREAWDASRMEGGHARRGSTPEPRRNALSFDRFLSELAATSNVSASAEAAGLTTGTIYNRRRSDPAFAQRWYAALAEGYDNLEMELLGRLRAGDRAGADTEAGDSAPKVKFDTATALRCLTAHRESVAREKGRRTLAAEVMTIAAINAKIDAMRLKRDTTQKAVLKVRKDKTKNAAMGGVSDAQG